MIKKAYEKPTVTVVKLQQSQMLCTSPKTLQGTGPDDWEDLD